MSDIINIYRVIKSDSGLFWIQRDGQTIQCKARSKLKKDSVIIGDFVTLDYSLGEPIIDSVIERKNRLIRPSVSNIDQIIIMVATVPQVDYLLLDKLIINARRQDIETVICINKTDIGNEAMRFIEEEYANSAVKIVRSSAIERDVGGINGLLKGKLTCIAGQSAVGKSTIVNVLLGKDCQKTGDLSKKIARGKNTTTASEIFETAGGYIVDTPGFSIVDLSEILPEEINLFYNDFDEFRRLCKFSTCTHISEPNCAVRAAAGFGEISIERYKRYLKIYAESKEHYERNLKRR